MKFEKSFIHAIENIGSNSHGSMHVSEFESKLKFKFPVGLLSGGGDMS